MDSQHIIWCKWRRSISLTSYFLLFLLLSAILVGYYLYEQDIGLIELKNDISKIKFVAKIIKTDQGVEANTKRLAYALQHKLDTVLPNNTRNMSSACGVKEAREKSCQKKGCLRLTLPKDPLQRIAQLVEPQHLRVNDKNKELLKSMGDSIPGHYDIILASGASSNHFKEAKSLISNLHAYVFPNLKNFTFIFYDLGLSKAQRDNISKTCQCHVRDFPFSRFSRAFSILKCYSWKPAIIYAHVQHCNVLHWMDTSIRFYKDPSRLKELYRHTRSRGLQIAIGTNNTPRVTLQSMFHFFGDEACSYHKSVQCSAGTSVFHNEPLTFQAVITPWIACAFNDSCMCPQKEVAIKKALSCGEVKYGPGYDYRYAQCHRFDQSALTIIVRKIFKEKSHHIVRADYKNYFSIRRGDRTLIETSAHS